MQSLWMLSCLCLSATGVLCVAGVLSHSFDDSLLQRFGMAVLCLFCFGRARAIWETQVVNVDWFGVHLGTAMFAVGTALKVYGAWTEKRLDRFGQAQHAGHRMKVPW